MFQIPHFRGPFAARRHHPRHSKSSRLPSSAFYRNPTIFVSSWANMASKATSVSSALATGQTATFASRNDLSCFFSLRSLMVAAAASFSLFLWRPLRFFGRGTNPSTCFWHGFLSFKRAYVHDSSRSDKSSRPIKLHNFRSLPPIIAMVLAFVPLLWQFFCKVTFQMPPTITAPISHYNAELHLVSSNKPVVGIVDNIAFGL